MIITPEKAALEKADWILFLENNAEKLTDLDREWLVSWRKLETATPIYLQSIIKVSHLAGFIDGAKMVAKLT